MNFNFWNSGSTPQLFVSQPPQLDFLQADSSQLQPHFNVLDAGMPQWVQPPPLQLSSLQVVAPQLLLPSQPGCVQAESPQFVLLQPYAAPAPTLWNEQSVLSLEPPQSLVETNEVQISDDDGQETERSILQPPLEEFSSLQPQPAPETPPCGELHSSVSVEAPSDIMETEEVQVSEEHGDTEERNTHLQKVSEEHGDGEERDVPQPPLREHLLAEDPLLECENASINQKRALVANTDDADGKETNDMGVLCKKIRPTTRVQKKHAGDRRFACDLCSSSFTHKTNLTRHIRNHNGERPFKCCVCDASFMYKWVLNTHMRTHTGERPYACSVCNASFNVKQSLICHMRVHTGERPFVCSVCNAWFLHKDTLVNHMRTHTGSVRM